MRILTPEGQRTAQPGTARQTGQARPMQGREGTGAEAGGDEVGTGAEAGAVAVAAASATAAAGQGSRQSRTMQGSAG